MNQFLGIRFNQSITDFWYDLGDHGNGNAELRLQTAMYLRVIVSNKIYTSLQIKRLHRFKKKHSRVK